MRRVFDVPCSKRNLISAYSQSDDFHPKSIGRGAGRPEDDVGMQFRGIPKVDQLLDEGKQRNYKKWYFDLSTFTAGMHLVISYFFSFRYLHEDRSDASLKNIN